MTVAPVVLVTGASSGIGEATAREAAERGAHVVLVARGAGSLARVGGLCDEAGAASTLCLSADLGDDEAVRTMVEKAIAEHGRLDVVVSNAGVVAYGRLEDVPADVFDGVIATNLLGPVNLARHVLPVLRAQREGAFVLVGSVIGHIAVPEMAAYAVSKWGVRALARQLQVDNRDRPGLRIGYVAPGGVDTPIYEQAAVYGDSVGRPPFPVTSPEVVARRILAIADGSRRRSQVGLANDLMRVGFSALPFAYDRLVGPLFKVAAQDLTRPVVRGPGNVLDSREDGNALHGSYGNAAIGIGRNLASLLRAVAGGSAAQGGSEG